MSGLSIFALATNVVEDAFISVIVDSLKSDTKNVVVHGICGFYMRKSGCVPLATIKNFYDINYTEYLATSFFKLKLWYRILYFILFKKPKVVIIGKYGLLNSLLGFFANKIGAKVLRIDSDFKNILSDNYFASYQNNKIKPLHPLSYLPKTDVLAGCLLLHPGYMVNDFSKYISFMLSCAARLYEIGFIERIIIVVGDLKAEIEQFLAEEYLQLPISLVHHISIVRPKLALVHDDYTSIEAVLLQIPYLQVVEDMSKLHIVDKILQQNIMQNYKIDSQNIDIMIQRCCNLETINETRLSQVANLFDNDFNARLVADILGNL